jgi:hypothetical protein
MACSQTHHADVEQHLCFCGGILLARYDLDELTLQVPRERITAHSWSEGLWRYAELLPFADPTHRVALGAGATPLLPLPPFAAEPELQVWLKDEGLNPTGSFKARGAAVGVSRARELSIHTAALPTAGNAGAAWAAYGTRAGLPVVVAMPRDAPQLTQREVQLYGARLRLVDGLISDVGAWINEHICAEGWYDASGFLASIRAATRPSSSSSARSSTGVGPCARYSARLRGRGVGFEAGPSMPRPCRTSSLRHHDRATARRRRACMACPTRKRVAAPRANVGPVRVGSSWEAALDTRPSRRRAARVTCRR